VPEVFAVETVLTLSDKLLAGLRAASRKLRERMKNPPKAIGTQGGLLRPTGMEIAEHSSARSGLVVSARPKTATAGGSLPWRPRSAIDPMTKRFERAPGTPTSGI
jgi:hypothetical protein